MKHVLILLTTATLLHGQGPLTPPGAPAPGMKTLQQIEPRTPISSLPFTIIQSGSYYLTGNLQFTATTGNAITINASGVTLDLMGFTLSSQADVTGSAIRVSSTSTKNIHVKNGNISGNTTVTIGAGVWSVTEGGFSSGVNDSSTGAKYENLSITGCRSAGLDSSSHAVISQVHAGQNGGTGISAFAASIANSTCRLNGGTGISADEGSVANSTCRLNGGTGISVNEGSVTNSTSSDNDGTGIYAIEGCVTNSISRDNNNFGIVVSAGSVTGCTSTSNAGNDMIANSAVVAFCKFVTHDLTGSTRTGNLPSP